MKKTLYQKIELDNETPFGESDNNNMLVLEKKSIKKDKEKSTKANRQRRVSDNLKQHRDNRLSRRSTRRTVKQSISDTSNKPEVQIISLGGLEEIGKNMTVIRCNGQAIIVDCGLAFPDDDLLGIDVVIPDFSYVKEIEGEILGLFLTHGHEDHIGGIPFFLEQFSIPIYGTPLTVGMVKNKLIDTGLDTTANLIKVDAGESVQLGQFNIELIHMNHSIPGSVALCITTPGGTIVHTGDFKIDYTPVLEKTADLGRLAEIGEKGVLALLCDSTNAERPGSSISERVVGSSFESLFKRAEGKRVIIATFASNVQRIQQIVDFAENHNRKIIISGRSMQNTVSLSKELGYLHCKDDTVLPLEDINRYRPDELVIITTGSQGEPMSALARMAAGTHRQVTITEKDMIIISATPIPGNEKTVNGVINALLKLGSDVIYESMYEIHASGHACQNDIKLILSLLKPKYYIPVHGEYKHLKKNAEIARQMGYAPERTVLAEIGDIIKLSESGVQINERVSSGRVLVDGIGVGDVGGVVIRDRQHLATDGLMVIVCAIDQNTGSLITSPDIISRGFVYMKESEELINRVKEIVVETVENFSGKNRRGRSNLKSEVRTAVSNYLYDLTKRNPMILTMITEI